MIRQLLNSLREPYRVRLLDVLLKRRHIAPARMDIELVRVSDRLKRMIVKTARFTACWPMNIVDRLLQFALRTRASAEAGEQEYFHQASPAIRRRIALARQMGQGR